MAEQHWRQATKDSPCPACGKDHYCAVTPDGTALRCMGNGNTPQGMVRIGPDRNGGTLYGFAGDSGRPAGVPRPPAQPPAKASARVALSAMVEAIQQRITDEQVASLAADLHVSTDSLRAIGIGWATAEDLRRLHASGAGWAENPPDGAFAFPERDGDGRLVGLSLRTKDGRKGAPARSVGARRGLIVPAVLHDLPGRVIAVEGASDVAGCITTGLPAVGRPSNTAGADDLAKLLRGRDVLVAGERDQKADGRWPGRDGAMAIARRLAAAWGEPVDWALPPEGAKDIRAWLAARVEAGLDLTDAEACRAAGRDLLQAMEASTHRVKSERCSAADRLVRLALERYRLGRTEADEPFAVEHDGPNVALMFRGSKDALRSMLAREYRRRYGRTPNAAAIVDALAVLQGEALDVEPEPVHLRVAEHNKNMVIDLGDTEGRAVVVRSGAWEVVSPSPVLFRRTALTGGLPMPARGGQIEELERLLNVSEETWPLVRGWLVSALMPGMPHPILMLGGEQGTGKTTCARMLVGLIDPSPAPLRSEPRDPEGWALAAAGSWAVAVDNVSRIPGWWSDALCKAVTGDGWIRRRLYSDADLAVLSFRRVVALTSIDAGAFRGDLGDRLLLAELERIDDSQRRTEADLDRAYAEARPRLLGAVLDALADVLARLPAVNLRTMPRMADFARVLAALDEADAADGHALALYEAQKTTIASNILDADPVAGAVVKLIEVSGSWQGTAGELLQQITPDAGRPPHGWPSSPVSMAGRLKRLTPALRSVGIEIEHDRVGHGRTRRYTLLRNGAQGIVRTVRTEAPKQHPPAQECGQSADVSGDCGRSAEADRPHDGGDAGEPSGPADDADGSARQTSAAVDAAGQPRLDPDHPGATDLLSPEQYATYRAVYYSRPADMPPAERHARAWRAALRAA